jgi:agmatinase
MATQDFDPNGVGLRNGNLFGLPVLENQADLVVIPIPWDVTASYGKGTAYCHENILNASSQIDYYHPFVQETWQAKVYMAPVSKAWQDINHELNVRSKKYIDFLEQGGDLENNAEHLETLQDINEATEHLRQNLFEKSLDLLAQGKMLAVLGGEHAVPLGAIQALASKHEQFGILQIDAHADLRQAYEGFTHSHASIFYNVLQAVPAVKKLVQVGIRDICQAEIDFAQSQGARVQTFYDYALHRDLMQGKTWQNIAQSIVQALPDKVYISFDIDGLQPSDCPSTGTPVPGGLSYNQVLFLFEELLKSGKQIIGFDLCEVGSKTEWDAVVGMRVLWQLSMLALATCPKKD